MVFLSTILFDVFNQYGSQNLGYLFYVNITVTWASGKGLRIVLNGPVLAYTVKSELILPKTGMTKDLINVGVKVIISEKQILKRT